MPDASGQSSFWDTLKGTAYTQASKVLQPLSGTFSTVIGNVTGTAQAKVKDVADRLNSTTRPGQSNVDLKTSPSIPDANNQAAVASTATMIGLLVAAVLLYFLMRKKL